MNASKTVDAGRLIAALAVSQLAGAIGSIFAAASLNTWYVTLAKPSFAPPGWMFGPIWIVLYALMGIAAWLVWREGFYARAVRAALLLFAAQLVLNAAWSLIFFGLRRPLTAFVEIAVVWVLLVITTAVFARVSRPAAIILGCCAVWVTFAAALNISIIRLNP